MAGFAVLAVLALAGFAVFNAVKDDVPKSLIPHGVAASVVFDRATSNAEAVPMTGALGDQLRDAADGHRGVRLIGIDGDGSVSINETVDMTPRLENGTILKVEDRAQEATAKSLAAVADVINGSAAEVQGQAMFLGLSRLQLDTDAPVYIVSSLLDTTDPVDMRSLGWDFSADELIVELDAAGELPDLTDAEVIFVVRPVSGSQEQLRQPHIEYREAVWTALATASGARSVTFEYPDGSPSSATLAAPVVPIPPPPTTPVPVSEPEPESRVQTCTVDTSAYFGPDSDQLLDEESTRIALANCVAQIGPGASVEVIGHTAGRNRESAYAQDLSERRAKAIKTLLESMGVPTGDIEAIGMGNRDQPYPDNPSDARNRSVVVSITNK